MGSILGLLLIIASSTNNISAQQTSLDNVTSAVDIKPNINAENIFNTKTMTLGNNVKALVILIPDEGHHGEGEDDESRFLDQHFIPDNVVVNTGTIVIWFNGDVGHEHTIDIKDQRGNSVFNTGEITELQPSKPFTATSPGVFNYEAEGDPGVTMTGSIAVGNIQYPIISSSANNASSNTSNSDTVGVIMVPTQDIDSYIQRITNAGITVDNTYDFKDLRGGQKGTGDTQTLIVWTTVNKDLNETLSSLSEISADLPYS
jgi:plastocyanin